MNLCAVASLIRDFARTVSFLLPLSLQDREIGFGVHKEDTLGS